MRLGALRGILKEIQDIWAIGLDEVLDYWFEVWGYFVAGFGFFERCLNKVGCVLEKNIIESGIASGADNVFVFDLSEAEGKNHVNTF